MHFWWRSAEIGVLAVGYSGWVAPLSSSGVIADVRLEMRWFVRVR